jgi:hypothetical protein
LQYFFRRSVSGQFSTLDKKRGYRMQASILQFLKTSGEGFDIDIAKALRMSVREVKSHVSQLSSAGEVICCEVTRYQGGKKIQGISCRLSGFAPAFSRGPKPGAKRAAAQKPE